MTHAALGFPVWIRATHWINVLFIGFLIRAGLQILGAYPRLYWNVHCTPGTEWLKFTKKVMPKDRLWTALDMEEAVPTWLGQPGGNNLGMGRHWHFSAALFWVLYAILLFATGEWTRLIPTSWDIFPAAWHTFITYATLGQPPAGASHPFDPLQQLAYAAVIFVLAPFLILTGGGAIAGHRGPVPPLCRALRGTPARAEPPFPRPRRLRRLHHYAYGAGGVYGVRPRHGEYDPRAARSRSGAGRGDRAGPDRAHPGGLWAHLLVLPVRAPPRAARAQYPPGAISPYFIVNGRPPETPEYQRLQRDGFVDWHIEVRGLVARPHSFSLAEVRALPKQTQITAHHCIQGWSGIASWGGPPLSAILEQCEPLPAARYAIFHSYHVDTSNRPFYEALDLRLAGHPQTLLAYEMNDAPLTVPHGAPVRLRVETLLGFKMVKWLCAIELVADYRGIRDGQGGSREDNMYYEESVSI